MLRYIYLLHFFINFELVFSYNYIRSNSRPHRSVGERIKRRQYGSEDSPLASLDLVNFMQKPEDPEDFETYGLESKRRPSNDEDPARRMRRSRHKISADDVNSATMSHPQQHSHITHLNRKSTFFKFPFFSHSNKSKPGTPKHKHKRKSHSLKFFKRKPKHEHYASTPPVSTPEYEKSHLDLQINAIPKIEGTTEKRTTLNCKMKMTRVKKSLPDMIHNSRQYFANSNKINDSDGNKVSNENKVNHEGKNRRDNLTGEKLAVSAGAPNRDLLAQQKEQEKVLEDLENRLKVSYHVLRNLFKK